ncbi:hypothetical protein G3480_00685 [Thiorhodococcus mannitoliphagus]|uniref:Apple domain-containing protein n=1 Tax=Thiorhodococcus mannitoliphagus TaxID=329406 RepID=A0A6P1DLP9_9GAMM|nr:PAN/Apple domain-containing protein [Thiorhodococcus mannitoliphagus]NEX18849.1 hypothetical protein [Thiorhodococcus mannitoliphagus]
MTKRERHLWTAFVGLGVVLGADLSSNDAQARQCVKAAFGIGYVAKVDWYEYGSVVGGINNVTGDFEVEGSTKAPVKSEKIAVGQESCGDDATVTRTALVRVVGGDIADWTTKIAAAGVGAVAGAAICVGTAGTGCGVIASAIAGTAGAAAGGAPTLAIPDVKEVFYVGAPSHYRKLELGGTVWGPTYEEGEPATMFDIPGSKAFPDQFFRMTNNAALRNASPYKTLYNTTIGACAFACQAIDITRCKSFNYYPVPSAANPGDKKQMFSCELFDKQAAEVCGTSPARVMKAEIVNYYEKTSLPKKQIAASCTKPRDDG